MLAPLYNVLRAAAIEEGRAQENITKFTLHSLAPINVGVDMDTVDRGIFRYRKFRVHEIIVVASEQKDENFILPLHGIMTN